MRRLLTILLCAALILTMYTPTDAFGAVKSLKRPVIKSVSVDDSSVTLSWKKIRHAKKYEVFVQTGKSNKWKYWKSVTKNSRNKARYSDSLKFKLKSSGKKYRIYKRTKPYKKVRTTAKLSFTYHGDYDTGYRFVIRAKAGKTVSKYSKAKYAFIPPAPEEPLPTYAITYEMNGGVNAPDNPAAYTAGIETVLADPARDDYAFLGWFTDSGLTNRISSIGADVSGDITLYAKWSQQPLRIDEERTAENAKKVAAYADRLYRENTMDSYLNGGFTWDQQKIANGWIYYNGFMMEAFLHTDINKYHGEVKRYYDQFINENSKGAVSIRRYGYNALDSMMPAAALVELYRSDYLTDEEKAKYTKAINWLFGQAEKQTAYPQAGNLLLHHQKSDGTPHTSASPWNIFLDGIYMSQLFLTRAAEASEEGSLDLRSSNGDPADTDALWNDAYSRFLFVMQRLVDEETGLPYHGYSAEEDRVNGVIWSRAIGWMSMAFLETAEKMPDPAKKGVLADYYTQLMESLLAAQDPYTSLWYNVTNERENIRKNIPETSGSSMFAYCLLRGFHDGLLKDEKFRTAGLRAFNSLVETKLTSDGLTDTLISMGVSENPNAYQNPQFVTNEAKGVAALILASGYAY